MSRSRPMTDLREDWDDVAKRLSAAPRVCVLTDFDGTLVPHLNNPDRVKLPSLVRRLLQSLAGGDRTLAGIVSGRSLADLLPRVGVDGLWIVGNHGFEIRDPAGKETRFFEDREVALLDRVLDELVRETAGVPGVHLEHKGPIIALHFRRVEVARVAEVQRAFCRVMERHRQQLMMGHGDQVFEARLRSARNKGTAVRQIRRELPPGTLVIYIGDDLTDRDAFRELQGVGITVEVGKPLSGLALYSLPDPTAVWEVLQRTVSLLIR